LSRKTSLSLRLLSAFLRIFFKLLYHQLAWTYDWVAAVVSVGMWKDWVLVALPYLNGPHVLELGHGPGHLQAALHRARIFTVGLDESRQMGGLAFKRIKRTGKIPVLVNGYAHQLPFPDHSFHQVAATFPSEYIYDLAALHEINRVLIPGGSLIILPLAWITGKRLQERLAAWLFHFTGQAPEWDDRIIDPFLKVGFIVDIEQQVRPSSVVLVIRAGKPIK
jgi:ubiquinone/menaquinone biosynthesis C-methylase UbiE